jgi:hypothetical protein
MRPTPADAQASALISLGLGDVVAPAVIPALDPRMLALLCLLLGAIGLVAVRRT